mmetsp:Transcript_105900/g.297767  ORF Transcript_105900/g.297767 Transcript_105900/m.297767 type:complete len:411 (-) Transcript_105900:128-1360(-)
MAQACESSCGLVERKASSPNVIDSAPRREPLGPSHGYSPLARAISRPLHRSLSCCALVEDLEGGVEEQWVFEEDAYTLGINALVLKGLPWALPEVLLAIAVPMLQGYIFFEIVGLVISQPPPQTSCGVLVILVCCFLAGATLSNEVIEGLRKVVFALRALSGVYENVASQRCMWISFILGASQLLMAACSFTLCFCVTLTATSALDAFMNFVTMAFIADIDNVLMRSRAVKEYVQCNPELTMKHAVGEAARVAACPGRVLVCLNAILLLGVPFAICVYNLIVGVHDPPVELDWVAMIPGAVVVWVSTNLTMALGSKWLGPVPPALAIAAVSTANSLNEMGLDLLGWRLTETLAMSPLSAQIAWAFGIVSFPGALALELDPFARFAYLPPFAVLVLFQCIAWLIHSRRIGA